MEITKLWPNNLTLRSAQLNWLYEKFPEKVTLLERIPPRDQWVRTTPHCTGSALLSLLFLACRERRPPNQINHLLHSFLSHCRPTLRRSWVGQKKICLSVTSLFHYTTGVQLARKKGRKALCSAFEDTTEKEKKVHWIITAVGTTTTTTTSTIRLTDWTAMWRSCKRMIWTSLT